PQGGAVSDGLSSDVNFQSSATTLSANWTGFTDAESNIAGYAWAIGTSPGATDIQPFTGVGGATNATNSGLSLFSGTTYYVTVQATDGAGLTRNVSSDGVLVDTSSPAAGTVNDGNAADIDFQSSTTDLSANWTGFSDDESAVVDYAWAIGTTPGGV